jgi:hypothetical protein
LDENITGHRVKNFPPILHIEFEQPISSSCETRATATQKNQSQKAKRAPTIDEESKNCTVDLIINWEGVGYTYLGSILHGGYHFSSVVRYDNAIWFHSKVGAKAFGILQIGNKDGRMQLVDLDIDEPYVTTGKPFETPAHHFYVRTDLMLAEQSARI